jgi:hypothetical protein
MAAEVMVTVGVVICMLGDTVMAGVVTRMVVMVGQVMLITDLLMATVAPATVMVIQVMVIQAMVMLTTGMAGGITVTGTPAMVAGGVAIGTHMALEPVGVSGQELVGFGCATNRNAWVLMRVLIPAVAKAVRTPGLGSAPKLREARSGR